MDTAPKADTASDDSGSTGPDDRLRRPDLIEAIAARVSLKRSEAKMVFDVVLDEIGKALDASDEVVVPPLGKLMVKKRDVKPGGPMLTLKLKRADVAPMAGDLPPLADAGEDS
jgi:nucleoid DNA-binding protein